MKEMKVHMKNLGAGCGLNRMDGESDESAYEKSGRWLWSE